MNKEIKIIGFVTILLSVSALVGSYFLSGYWQSLVLSIFSTFLGLGLAVFLVNFILSRADKKAAAEPLLRLIMPNIKKAHNDLFIQHLRNELGKDQMESLLEIYQKHKRNPDAFSPEQREKLYSAIVKIRGELEQTYDALQDQFRELTLLLGWSFDSKITGLSFNTRLLISQFSNASWDGSPEDQKKVLEAYIDIDGSAGTLLETLSSYLGLAEEQWQTDS